MSLVPGDLAEMHCTKGFLAIVLPGGEQFALDGQKVRVLAVGSFQGMKLVTFRPEPWSFPPEAWPNAWQAVEGYFSVADDQAEKRIR
jgi:hypothetical protein